MGASGHAPSPHSLTRHILQRTARAEWSSSFLRVIAVDHDAPGVLLADLKKVTLAEAAGHLVVLDVRDHEDLHGVDVVAIPGGQDKHPLFEAAEVRRRSRMTG